MMKLHMSSNVDITMAHMKTIVKTFMNYKETKFLLYDELNSKQNYDELKEKNYCELKRKHNTIHIANESDVKPIIC